MLNNTSTHADPHPIARSIVNVDSPYIDFIHVVLALHWGTNCNIIFVVVVEIGHN